MTLLTILSYIFAENVKHSRRLDFSCKCKTETGTSWSCEAWVVFLPLYSPSFWKTDAAISGYCMSYSLYFCIRSFASKIHQSDSLEYKDLSAIPCLLIMLHKSLPVFPHLLSQSWHAICIKLKKLEIRILHKRFCIQYFNICKYVLSWRKWATLTLVLFIC